MTALSGRRSGHVLVRRAPGCALAVLALAATGPALAASPGGLTAPAGLFALLAALGMALVMALEWQAPMSDGSLPAWGAALALLGAGWWWLRLRAAPSGRSLARADPRAPVADAAATRVTASASIFWPDAPATLRLPVGIDRANLLADMRASFVQVQAAWDAHDLPRLARLTTPEMYDELRGGMFGDASAREAPGDAASAGSNRTDVLALRARLLAFEVLPDAYLASVEFGGLIREHPEQGARPFRELWLLARPAEAGSPWRLARHQALL